MENVKDVRRRRLIAGAAALVAGMAVVRPSQSVAAETVDNFFTATDTSYNLRKAYRAIGSGYAAFATDYVSAMFPADYQYGVNVTGSTEGVRGVVTSGGNGVKGEGANGNGVYGTSTSTSGNAGVAGYNGSGNNAIGVRGTTTGTGVGVQGGTKGGANTFNGTGVLGLADGGIGVQGMVAGGAIAMRGQSVSGIGVQGLTNGSSGAVVGQNGSGISAIGVQGDTGTYGIGVLGTNVNGTGVRGQVTGGYGVNGVSNYIGVRGDGNGGIGVYGVSTGGANPFGVVGSVTTAPGFALFGIASVAGTVGFAAGASVAGAIAGQFSGSVNIYNSVGADGNLYVQGNQTASGTKSAAVPHPDGSHRLLYCVESPEAWFEDFGTGTLAGGKADVKLDADFAAVVDTSTLHVFTESHDEHHALHVASTNATGFRVGAVPSSTGVAAGKKVADLSGTFTYRVVAKRKDVKAERLAKFTMPQEIKLAPPPIPPTPPEAPKLPAPPAPPAPAKG